MFGIENDARPCAATRGDRAVFRVQALSMLLGREVFFKEIKQTLQLADFLGYNGNAVRWQA